MNSQKVCIPTNSFSNKVDIDSFREHQQVVDNDQSPNSINSSIFNRLSMEKSGQKVDVKIPITQVYKRLNFDFIDADQDARGAQKYSDIEIKDQSRGKDSKLEIGTIYYEIKGKKVYKLFQGKKDNYVNNTVIRKPVEKKKMGCLSCLKSLFY